VAIRETVTVPMVRDESLAAQIKPWMLWTAAGLCLASLASLLLTAAFWLRQRGRKDETEENASASSQA
jgi:hypothetical protein